MRIMSMLESRRVAATIGRAVPLAALTHKELHAIVFFTVDDPGIVNAVGVAVTIERTKRADSRLWSIEKPFRPATVSFT
jgi:hypothetical protein